MEATLQVRDALVSIQVEYVHMPQLKLSARQVQRLWNLPNDVCETVLAALLRKGFLDLASDGAYVRSGTRRATVDGVAALTRAS